MLEEKTAEYVVVRLVLTPDEAVDGNIYLRVNTKLCEGVRVVMSHFCGDETIVETGGNER